MMDNPARVFLRASFFVVLATTALTFTGTAAQATTEEECAWEWGGAVEPTPAACHVNPVDLDSSSLPVPVEEVSPVPTATSLSVISEIDNQGPFAETVTAGLGVLVLVSGFALVYSFRGRPS